MTDRIELAGLSVARELKEFIATEALPGTGVERGGVLAVFRRIVHDLAPKNRALLAKRDALQDQIDAVASRQWRAVRSRRLQGFPARDRLSPA